MDITTWKKAKLWDREKSLAPSRICKKPQTGGFWASRGKIFSAWGQKTFMIATQLMGGGLL